MGQRYAMPRRWREGLAEKKRAPLSFADRNQWRIRTAFRRLSGEIYRRGCAELIKKGGAVASLHAFENWRTLNRPMSYASIW